MRPYRDETRRYLWISSILDSYARLRFVCSTLVQAMWEKGGITLEKLADPEDLAREIETLTRVD